jgi:orotate phosphoribosyltransferase
LETDRVIKRRDDIVELVKSRGYEFREEQYELSSGELSHDYIDGKRAMSTPGAGRVVADAVLDLVSELGIEFDAIGGLTLGADSIAYAVYWASDKPWFIVRKEAKGHGKQRRIEGAELAAGTRVILVDDIVTTGKSILQGLDALEEVGADVVLAVTLVDRGEAARSALEARGVRYEPLATYRDLGIDPVGDGRIRATATG